MATITIYKNTISGSTMQMASVTASLFGTASYSLYGLTASYALNVSGTWNSASYTSPSQSVAGFGIDGRAILYTPTQDNVYLAKRGSTISWVPIETKFSAVSYADNQEYMDAMSQSVNYSNPNAIMHTEEAQTETSRIQEVYQFTEKEHTDMLQIVMNLTSSVGSIISGENFDTINGIINASGSISYIALIDMSQEFSHFFINTSGSMIYSNTYDSTIEYVNSFIYITSSMQPLITTTSFTTASI